MPFFTFATTTESATIRGEPRNTHNISKTFFSWLIPNISIFYAIPTKAKIIFIVSNPKFPFRTYMHKWSSHTAFTWVSLSSIWSSIWGIINKWLIFRSSPKATAYYFAAKRKAKWLSFSSNKWFTFCITNHNFIFTAHHILSWFNTVDIFCWINISITRCTINKKLRIKARSATMFFIFFFNC